MKALTAKSKSALAPNPYQAHLKQISRLVKSLRLSWLNVELDELSTFDKERDCKQWILKIVHHDDEVISVIEELLAHNGIVFGHMGDNTRIIVVRADFTKPFNFDEQKVAEKISGYKSRINETEPENPRFAKRVSFTDQGYERHNKSSGGSGNGKIVIKVPAPNHRIFPSAVPPKVREEVKEEAEEAVVKPSVQANPVEVEKPAEDFELYKLQSAYDEVELLKKVLRQYGFHPSKDPKAKVRSSKGEVESGCLVYSCRSEYAEEFVGVCYEKLGYPKDGSIEIKKGRSKDYVDVQILLYLYDEEKERIITPYSHISDQDLRRELKAREYYSK